jgi:hypothetical protein
VGDILDSLTNANIMELATDKRVLFVAGALFVLSLLFRWKVLTLFLFAIGATIGVIRYANLGEGPAAIDRGLITFGLGTVVLAGIIIYFLFIRSD